MRGREGWRIEKGSEWCHSGQLAGVQMREDDYLDQGAVATGENMGNI